MKRVFSIMSAIMLVAVWNTAFGQITTSLTNWITGNPAPVLETGLLPSGSTGTYFNVPVGTKSFYYEVDSTGEGMAEFWIYDPAICMDSANTMGYPARGPKWGMETDAHVAVLVGIDRAAYVGHCLGYSQWSTADATSPYWFASGVRGDGHTLFAAGWYKWQVTGTYDDITFKYFDTNYGAKTVSKTYNATNQPSWVSAFGSGWRGIYIIGDATGGPEAIKFSVSDGTGNFAGIGTSSTPARPYYQTTWGAIKALYR
jgi:hypothetical protein